MANPVGAGPGDDSVTGESVTGGSAAGGSAAGGSAAGGSAAGGSAAGGSVTSDSAAGGSAGGEGPVGGGSGRLSGRRTIIDYPDFSRRAGLKVVGSARMAGGVLRLTDGRPHEAGAAWAGTEVSTERSFDTSFTARLEEGADGIAFVLQGDGPGVVGGAGGSLGYGGLSRSLAVEFDTYENGNDPSDNHIAVVTGGRAGAVHGATVFSRVSLTGDAFLVRLSYDAEVGALMVRIKATDDPSAVVKVLTVPVELSRAVGGPRAYAGFTGATGHGASTQDIRSWSVRQ
jgi:hypothetical protein